MKSIPYQLEIPIEIYPKNVGQKSQLLLGFHGHAQSSNDLLPFLKEWADESSYYCSLAAPHNFATPRGVVVSTWMTKKNREAEIEAQRCYLKDAYKMITDSYAFLDLNIFGFSQGASVAYRSVFLSQLKPKLCFILAGDIPPEIKEKKTRSFFKSETKFILIYCEYDKIIPKEKILEDYDFLKSKGISVELACYPRGHECHPDLVTIIKKYEA